MNSNNHAALDANIATAIEAMAKALGKAVNDGRRTCVHCGYFDQPSEVCTFYVPASRPPAKVIAFGCPSFEEQVPF